MIIGLCGFKGSGKSVVANYIADNHGFTKVNFKDALIREMKVKLNRTLKELGYIYEMSEDELFLNKPPAMRALMQEYGTEIVRGFDDKHWIREYGKTVVDINNVVTDDVRFQNEYDAIVMAGGIIIRVERSDISTGGDHPSETEHLKFEEDFVIQAEPGNHQHVYMQIESIIDTLKKNVD